MAHAVEKGFEGPSERASPMNGRFARPAIPPRPSVGPGTKSVAAAESSAYRGGPEVTNVPPRALRIFPPLDRLKRINVDRLG